MHPDQQFSFCIWLRVCEAVYLFSFISIFWLFSLSTAETKYQPPQDDKPDNWKSSSEKDDDEDDDKSSTEEDDSDDDDDDDDDNDDNDDSSDNEDDENTADLYEAYLRGQEFPHKYNNEHKKFLAAKERMKKNQQHKVTKVRLTHVWNIKKFFFFFIVGISALAGIFY